MNELKLLREIAEKKKPQSKWTGSTFEIIKNMPTSNKGEVGEEFIFQLSKKLVDKNTSINPNKRDAYDMTILKKKIEIKIATEDTAGNFQFNGIRYHRKYDFLLVLGISPENVYFNIYNAADVKTQKIGILVPMEKGAVGTQKLTRKKDQLPNISKFNTIVTEVLKQK